MDTILFPLMWVIGWIIVGVHKVLTLIGMAHGPGLAWVLAIVGMTIIVRALMIPLFNKQIRSQRVMQRLTPEIQKIQKKYKGKKDQISQQRQQEELMALYKSHGSSPFASCLPMFIQMPIFFALYRVLWNIGPLSEGTYTRSLGGIDQTRAAELAGSTVFGAPLTSSIGSAGQYDDPTRVIIVAVVLIALMIITLFITQKQVMTKNMPVNEDPNNPAAKMTKYMLYGMPLIYVFTGYAFQVGVLVYWLASNIWNMGQQTWLINTNPSPGSPAYKARQEKLRAKRIAKGLPPEEDEGGEDLPERSTGQRAQPMSAKRQKKKGKKYDPLAHGPSDLSHEFRQGASAEDSDQDAVTSRATDRDDDKEPVGKDGLTDAQRAQKRYERRLAERQRSREKAQKRAKRQQQNKKQRNF